MSDTNGDNNMNEYPLEVVDMEDLGFFSEGHHDKQAFVDAVNKLVLDEGNDFMQEDVEYYWWREARQDERNYGFDVEYRVTTKDQPGAFPVTVVYI